MIYTPRARGSQHPPYCLGHLTGHHVGMYRTGHLERQTTADRIDRSPLPLVSQGIADPIIGHYHCLATVNPSYPLCKRIRYIARYIARTSFYIRLTTIIINSKFETFIQRKNRYIQITPLISNKFTNVT